MGPDYSTGQESPFAEFSQGMKKSLFSFLIKPVDKLVEKYGSVYTADAQHHLGLLKGAFPDKPWPSWAIEGFTRFNREILKEERLFKQSGHYSLEGCGFDSAREEVYDNPAVMENYYLVGLYLTYFFWPHHYELFSFFRSDFIQPDGSRGKVMEWGAGHGLLSLTALAGWPGLDRVQAYDISAFSLEFAERLITRAGYTNCEFIQADVLETGTERCDCLICGELLEHVENPASLLQKACGSLEPGGSLFLTAAANAAQRDHLVCFNGPGDIYDLVEKNGFRINSSIELIHPNRKGEERPPLVVGMVLEPRQQ